MAGLKTCTFCRAIVARTSRRISSSVLPLNIEPQITTIEPCVGVMHSPVLRSFQGGAGRVVAPWRHVSRPSPPPIIRLLNDPATQQNGQMLSHLPVKFT